MAISKGISNPHTATRIVARAALALAAVVSSVQGTVALAQVTSVDPDSGIDADLYRAPATAAPVAPAPEIAASQATAGTAVAAPGSSMETPTDSTATYRKADLIGAAEGVFGKGAQGLAGIIEDLLKKQGEPNGYIVGREGGGAFMVGLRYGSGTLHHKVEGARPVYWRGPSLGLDAGANAGNAFVLVYNLHDTQDLFHRYGAGEGQAYLVGGFHVSYMRRNDVVLIPVRMGAGLRLGANVGYMKFSNRQKWVPF